MPPKRPADSVPVYSTDAGRLCPGCGRAPATDSAATTVIEFWDFPHLPETNAYLQSAMEEAH